MNRRSLALFLILASTAGAALAQPYPSKPIRFVVGFPPGGSADPTTRIIGAAVALRKTPAYDPLKDFTPISLVGRATIFFYVHPGVPAKTLAEFVAHARANPGKLNYGTGNPLSVL
ncbi:MAG TPA: tripartite tricarboxylate transporter substrate-binding protein [Burkholderiales bacterium]|jgi:tripartite-type tricarboxylate transporter receptor subunit TctC